MQRNRRCQSAKLNKKFTVITDLEVAQRAFPGRSCRRNAKAELTRSPSADPWHPPFSDLWHAAYGEAALPPRKQTVRAYGLYSHKTRGQTPFIPDLKAAYRERMPPLARVITPNLPEAEALFGATLLDEFSLKLAARRLAGMFGTAVLLKGDYLYGAECLDLPIDAGEVRRFSAARIPGGGSHGAGCTFSAAITADLARGDSLPDVVKASMNYLGSTLFRSNGVKSERGRSHVCARPGDDVAKLPDASARKILLIG